MLLSKFLFALAASSVVSAGILLPLNNDAPVDQLVRRASTSTKSSTSSTKSSTSSAKSSTSSAKSSTSSAKSSTSSAKSSTSSTKASTVTSKTSSSTSSSASSSATVADSQCTNGPATRQCWGNGFSIATDYDSEWPVTGNTVSYSIDITNGTAAPDGYERLVLSVNGQLPGPTLYANWGDTLEITVTNKLQDNGTSIHWHGIRQWKSSEMDGTNGVTECPLAPGQSRTYSFLCTQFGTTWFHSHYSAQYGDGVVGTIIINGPATSNYDVDLGTMTVQDWYYQTAYQLSYLTSLGGPPPTANNGLINGTMVSSYGGSYHKNTITQGKKYRLRLINTSVDNHFKVSLDNHNLTVITADFVPIKPYQTNWLFIGIGQRYDVIIDANQAVGNYWFRAEVQSGCGSNANNGNIKSIFSYTGAASGNPTTTATAYTQSCADETNLVPYVELNVPSTSIIPGSSVLDVSFATIQTSGNQTAVQWNLNETAIQVDWEDPTLQYVLDGNTSYPKDLNLIALPQENAWTYWIIQTVSTAPAVPHPIHLHGHDFYVLGTGTGTFSSPSSLQFNNPPRRDVAMLTAGGWLAIAFITDNPGAWLMHCHIAWHIGEGLGVQFLERSEDILSTLTFGSDWKNECSTWKSWYATAPYKQDDSGL